jgi:hypothetical protein
MQRKPVHQYYICSQLNGTTLAVVAKRDAPKAHTPQEWHGPAAKQGLCWRCSACRFCKQQKHMQLLLGAVEAWKHGHT